FWDFQDNSSVNVASGASQFVAYANPLGRGGIAGPNTTAAANSYLRIKVWDFEVTQRLDCNCWIWNFGGGIRYLHTTQAFNATINGAANAVDDMTSSHRFKGVGPTLSLNGQRYLGCSGFSLYGNGRASVLVGDNTQNAQLTAANGTLGNRAQQSNWGTLSVTELEIGVAYQRTFGCFTMVGSTGLVGQYWTGIGNAANVDTFTLFGTDETQNNSINMALYGLRASLSFYY
ncbi:MAG: Lpg1974 family pore-forming outer membrane protein, partial [Pirellulales bacterium]